MAKCSNLTEELGFKELRGHDMGRKFYIGDRGPKASALSALWVAQYAIATFFGVNMASSSPRALSTNQRRDQCWHDYFQLTAPH